MQPPRFAPPCLLGAALIVAAVMLAASCGGESSAPQPIRTFKFLVNDIHIPTTATEARSLGVDLNGDGTPDNAVGALFASLESQGFSMQVAMDDAIAAGAIEHLIRVGSHDTTLTQDQGAAVDWYVASAGTTFPGPYSIDNGVPAGGFQGQIAGAAFASTNPATMTVPVAVALKLRFLGGTPVVLHLNGAAIRFSASAGAAPALVSGRIAGSLTTNDVQNVLVPAMAADFTAVIQADTSSTIARTLELLFDTGGCPGAVAHDYQIQACELTTNALMAALLAPDVQIYNNVGAYAPSAANTTPNALSAAFGFSAQLTSF